MDSLIFPINKYKGLTYKQVLQKNDDFYYKYLIREFKSYYCDIYKFYEYLRLNNKFVPEINKILNIKMVLDTETTGFYDYDRVLQLSYILFNEVQTLKTFDHYVKIHPSLKIKNSEIHGITNEICKNHGIPINQILDIFCYDLELCKALIGHNLQFDIRMLKSEFKRVSLNCDLLTCKPIEDTFQLGKQKYPKGTPMKLGDLHRLELKTDMVNAHNALYDVIATMNIYKKIKLG
jgi:DNA polymerase III alpha subunit (gram-positive type)